MWRLAGHTEIKAAPLPLASYRVVFQRGQAALRLNGHLPTNGGFSRPPTPLSRQVEIKRTIRRRRGHREVNTNFCTYRLSVDWSNLRALFAPVSALSDFR
ncbi:hypothetical protein XF30_13520 [Bradyrhizobium sp. SUTN9-2]|nr:hypothetical protein XF30_13520 [Bradyrhizobium sp. SUTN9-2]